MKRNTSQIIRAALDADDSVRGDLKNTALAVLREEAAQAPMHPILVTQAQAARLLGVSRITVYRMVQEGELEPVIIRGMRRYRREDLERIARGEAKVA